MASAELSEEVNNLSLEYISFRHRREKKELQAKIQELKKNVPKSEKKKRKETILQLESEMQQRHEEELKSIALNENLKEDNHDENDQNLQRVSKAQRRRDKKERDERQRQEEIKAAAEETLNTPSPKILEYNSIKAKLANRQLAVFQIASDGDCLFNAVRHQLEQNSLNLFTVKNLRQETANYIRAHKAELICYMTNPKTGELLDDGEFEKYVDDISSTSAWGGQIEIKALSSILKMPIEVLQADGPPTIQGENDYAEPNLVITYHRHMYSLGEHYNSTIPETEAEK